MVSIYTFLLISRVLNAILIAAGTDDTDPTGTIRLRQMEKHQNEMDISRLCRNVGVFAQEPAPPFDAGLAAAETQDEFVGGCYLIDRTGK